MELLECLRQEIVASELCGSSNSALRSVEEKSYLKQNIFKTYFQTLGIFFLIREVI